MHTMDINYRSWIINNFLSHFGVNYNWVLSLLVCILTCPMDSVKYSHDLQKYKVIYTKTTKKVYLHICNYVSWFVRVFKNLKKIKVIWFSLSFVWKPWWNTYTHIFWNSTSIIFFPPLESKTISHTVVLALAFINLAILQPLLSTNYLKYFNYCNYIMPHLSKVIPCYSLPNIFLKITICL